MDPPTSPSAKHYDTIAFRATKISLLNLPHEALKNIFFFVSPRDLANLSCVCRCFHDLAAAHLYRVISASFVRYDKGDDQSTVDNLPQVLQTIITSDYEYGRFIKEFTIDAEDYELTARDFEFGYACGEFLNVLIVSALKKAGALETFRWNLRGELRQSLLIALSKMKSLQNLHLRLQPGPSRHNAPQRSDDEQYLLPVLAPGPSYNSQSHYSNQLPFSSVPPPATNYQFNVSVVPTPPAPQPYLPAGHATAKSHKFRSPHRHNKRGEVTKKPQNISFFSNLKSLAVLDVDSLDYISEIAQCVAASASTLKTLKLSLSEMMALKARLTKTSSQPLVSDPLTDPEDLPPFSDPEPSSLSTSFAGPPSQFGGGVSSPTTNPAEVFREKTEQDKILARIFGMDKLYDTVDEFSAKFERGLFEAYSKAEKLAAESSQMQGDQEFVQALRKITDKIRVEAHMNGLSGRPMKALIQVEKAATKYLEAKERKENEVYEDSGSLGSSFESNTKHSSLNKRSRKKHKAPMSPPPMPLQQPPEDQQNKNSFSGEEKSIESEEKDPDSSSPQKFVLSSPNKEQDRLSDIVDMEHPDGVEDSDGGSDEELKSLHDSEEHDSDDDDDETKAPQRLALFEADSSQETSDDNLDLGSKKLKETTKKRTHHKAYNHVFKEMKRGEETTVATSSSEVENYMQNHHGFRLESLSLCYIPVKATVLYRAIDVYSLEHISLLHVGDQSGFWGVLQKLSESCPLKLTTIHTDHVTPPFVRLVNSLENVTELYMIQRNTKKKGQETLPTSTVTIDEIRTKILAKHILTLQRLMIRNEHTSTWTLNRRSVLLLTKFGIGLKELLVGVNSRSLHIFIQNLAGLRNLHALQLLLQERDNAAVPISREHMSVADVIVQCPSLKIRYVGVGANSQNTNYNFIAKIIRPVSIKSDPYHEESNQKSNSKGKVRAQSEPLRNFTDKFITELLHELQSGDDTILDHFHAHTPKVVTHLRMRDVKGVKMWEKENWTMCL